VRLLLAIPPYAALARQAHALAARTRGRCAAGVGDVIDLTVEVRDTAECRGIEHLHENGRAPAFRRIRASVSRERARRRFDEER